MLAQVTAALLLAASASAEATDACGAPSPAPATCSSYTLIDARGTGEEQGESLGFLTMNNQVLAQRTGGTLYNVVYSATKDQDSAPGTKDVIDQVGKILAQNASECVILQGYSQGATVIVDALPKLTGAAFDAVKGVILLGDPEHKPGLACNVDFTGGDATRDATGDLYGPGKGIPDDWVSKSLDVCNIGDSVCDVAAGNGTITPQHLYYPIDQGVQDMGAKFILKQLG